MRVPYDFSFKITVYPFLTRPWNSQNPRRDRQETLMFCIKALKKRKGFLIVETGCQRLDHGTLSWGDDGCSTLIFNLFAWQYHSSCISVDINPENIEYASILNWGAGQFILGDSVKFLETFDLVSKIDLLYLDSYDFDPKSPELSQAHHLKELLSVYEKLKSGCLILIDDADTNFDGKMFGKASLIIKYFDNLNILPIKKGYQILYIKP